MSEPEQIAAVGEVTVFGDGGQYRVVDELAALRARVAELEAELKLWKPMTNEEAEAAYDAAPHVPMSAEEIDRMVAFAVDPANRPTEPEHIQMLAHIRNQAERVAELEAQLSAQRDRYLLALATAESDKGALERQRDGERFARQHIERQRDEALAQIHSAAAPEVEVVTSDPVAHPSHYTAGKIQPIEVIEDWGLNFHLGNVVKYVRRHDLKESALLDLKKAKWYLDREISRWEQLAKEASNGE